MRLGSVYLIILKVANTSNRWFEIAGFQPSMRPLLKDQLKELVFCITGFGAECEDQRKLDPKG